jgi:hypothetical protein
MPADPCTAWLDSLMWASQVKLMMTAMVMVMRMIIPVLTVIVSMILFGHSLIFSNLAIKFFLSIRSQHLSSRPCGNVPGDVFRSKLFLLQTR